MTLVTWSPFREFEDLFNRQNRLGRRWSQAGENGGDRPDIDWRPAADISETDKAYLIKAELPAVKKEDVQVTVNDGVITIKGERRIEKSDQDEKQHRIESYYGTFSRSFSLPSDVDESGICAESKDGILEVRLPKTTEQAPTSLEIKVE